MMIKVYPCGTNVVTKVGKIQGIIAAIKIEFNSVIYNISYFSGDCFKNYEMNEGEFDVETSAKKQKIGFIQSK